MDRSRVLKHTTQPPPQILPEKKGRALEAFDHFCTANSLKNIIFYHRYICDQLKLKPNTLPHFYPKIKSLLDSWRAQAVWKKFDIRANHKCYAKGKACPNTRVLIIGAGPCGLRTAIEAQLLGAKVVVIEKRDRLSRNNVLHLWPFVIDDLRALGAKKFFGKFCAGSIDHISIRQLQCMLLKIALLLGVELHTEVSFEELIPPDGPSSDHSEKHGWRASFSPAEHPVSQYEFDVLIGADGKRNTLEGFKRKEFRGKLAIAITANFINKKTEAEARVEEISGVAFIFNQKFFKDLNAETGIDLENIVYYKDETHYFVMTAKKQSLIEKGVILQDMADTAKLLAPENVDRNALMEYAKQAAEFSTHYQMPNMEFALNHYGQADVAMFDFTSMYAAENASKVIERNGHKLLKILVGDSLLEPFWPTGSGCARGFLSSLDACWAIRAWGSGLMNPLEVIAERESIYRLLGQTTPENLHKDSKAYTLDPSTRYPNLNKNAILPVQVKNLFETDDPASLDLPVCLPVTMNKKRRRRDSHVHQDTLLSWLKQQVAVYSDLEVGDLTSSFKDGLILCAIIHRYRPDLLDFSSLKKEDAALNNQLAFDILEKELGVPPVMTGQEMAQNETPDFLAMVSYLTQIYNTFRGEIPHVVKLPKLQDMPEYKALEKPAVKPLPLTSIQISRSAADAQNRMWNRHKRHSELMSTPTPAVPSDRKSRKRRSGEKIGASMEERQRRLEEIAVNRADRQSRRRQHRKMQTEQFIKSMQMLQANAKPDSSGPFEDYSIYLYRQTAPNFEDRVKDLEKKLIYPALYADREERSGEARQREADEEFTGRIKEMEGKLKEPTPAEKKPKDLMRAIGKIETTDWNIKEIEKKIQENKMGKSVNKEKEKVPKWSREQFVARQTKMEKKGLDRQDSVDEKYIIIDKSLKHLDQRLKEGSVRDQGQNKVAYLAEQLKAKQPDEPGKPVQRSNSKVNLPPAKVDSENCHFCAKRVYLMERLSAEGRFFHRGCFRCQYCSTVLRLGSYLFDRGNTDRFYCNQHFGMQGHLKGHKIVRKSSVRNNQHGADKKMANVAGVDLLDRVQTPERAEFSNLSLAALSDHEENLSQMDEDEWTDRNFGASAAELGSSDDSTDSSDTESDNEDEDEVFEEAMEESLTKEGTLRLAKRWRQHYSKDGDEDSGSLDDFESGSEDFSYYENSSEDEGSETATEGEEELRARELRKEEVRVKPPIVTEDTGSDTEIASEDETTSKTSENQNSATEISTDSEFAQDDPTPTRELPIFFDDYHVTKHRGTYRTPKKVQVKSGELQKPMNGRQKPVTVKLGPIETTPAVRETTPDIANVRPAPLVNPRPGDYLLNRTQSTGGIATKVSLELKKKYLLGSTEIGGSIQKSGSASTLDSAFKLFHSNISEHQKLLNPANEVSPSMQAFLQATAKLREKTSPTGLFEPKKPEVIIDLTADSGTPEKLQPELPTPELPSPEIIDLTLTPSDKAAMQPDLTKNIVVEEEEEGFQHDSEGRPRSPLHETSLIVPNIRWEEINKKPERKCESDIDTDSLSSEGSLERNPYVKLQSALPTVEIHIHGAEEEEEPCANHMDWDSLGALQEGGSCTESNEPVTELLAGEAPKSLEKKSLNQPKTLPQMAEQPPASGRSSPGSASEGNTELSDWAREGAVSDDLDDDQLDPDKKRGDEKQRAFGHVCGKAAAPMAAADLDSIEFMDTGSEAGSRADDLVQSTNTVLLKNRGYVQFTYSPDSLAEAAPHHQVAEAVNRDMVGNFGGEVIDLLPDDLERLKEKQHQVDNDEDSLLIVDTSTNTAEDSTTVSESTVKLVENPASKVADDGNDDEGEEVVEEEDDVTPTATEEYEKHVQRLSGKVAEFSNARDSIDVRKSKRKNAKSDSSRSEEAPAKAVDDPQLGQGSPATSRKIEEINKERKKQKDLIHEMVLSKLQSSRRLSSDKKRRVRNTNFELAKSATIDIAGRLSSEPTTPDVLLPASKSSPADRRFQSIVLPEQSPDRPEYYTPVTSVRELNPKVSRPLSLHASFLSKQADSPKTPALAPLPSTPLTHPEAFSMPDIHRELYGTVSPVAPPRKDEVKRTTEKVRQDAKVRARLMTDEQLGLSPEERIKLLKQRMHRKLGKENINEPQVRREQLLLLDNAAYYTGANDHLKAAKSLDFNENADMKQSLENGDDEAEERKCQFYKSDPNLLTDPSAKKKPKDRERRRSFLQSVTEFFQKRKEATPPKQASPSPKEAPKDKFSRFRITAKSKDRSKDKLVEEPVRSKSVCDTRQVEELTPPPIPPRPLNYYPERDSGSDSEGKMLDNSMDNLNQSEHMDGSMSSLGSRRLSRGTKKAARQAQLKRHRLAQEIQRKLEETEVKTRELEQRGVVVEKALRGECSPPGSPGRYDETELLREWFDLMRDRTELRRYERELLVRADELELEDRHARLKQDLMERLSISDQNKSKSDVAAEGAILREMLDIVARRDSLVALLEEDRKRYHEEDRDFEAQMLSKGLRLTPLKKTPDK